MAAELNIEESPLYVQTSLAAAMTLGLKPGRFLRDVKLQCLNLLLTYPDSCRGRCSYCGLSKQRQCTESAKTFIRVSWPTYSVETIMHQLETFPHPLERVCISMVTTPRAVQDTVLLVKLFRERTDLYISVLAAPSAMSDPKADLQRLKDAGADMCGIAVDAATTDLFVRHRGSGVNGPHRWERYWQTVSDAIEVFGRLRVGIHLIVGLGETEEEMAWTIQRGQDLGAHTHLFSFFPEAGSDLQGWSQPPLAQYRRVQLARYLINECGHKADLITFDPTGKVVDFGYDIESIIAKGEAFLTSGCHGKTCRYACNRPFGNERPSEPIRNYPFWPNEADLDEIREQLGL